MQQTINKKTKFSYALSAIPFGIKEQSFNGFLMIYYNQVLGLSPVLTGTAILIALCVDAITDPLIGYYSDNLKTKYGSRHPLIYAAILPTVIAFIALWNPPAQSQIGQWQLFSFLTVSAIFTRGFLGLFEIPISALLPQITKDYDQRTMLTNLRFGVGWVSQITITIITFVFFLVPTDTVEKGVLNPQGYQSFSLLAGFIIFATMLASGLGTHKKYATSNTTTETTEPPKSFLPTLKALFSMPNFRAIFFADIGSMVAFGVSIAMQLYFATYLFDLSSKEIAPMGPVAILGALLAMWLTPKISATVDKRRIAITATVLSLLFGNAGIWLRILGWFPENGSALLVPAILVLVFFSTIFVIIKQTMMTSMTADLIEAFNQKNGQKVQALFFAATSFSRKTVTGLGIFVSGLILSISSDKNENFAQMFADPTGIPLAYIIIISLAHITTILFLTKYSLTRIEHNENLKRLRVKPKTGS